ncbi:putative transcription factor TGA like domain-containing protein [Helianthus debilis subsp. tardiflorus]
MVELSNVVSEMIRNENGGVEDEENKVESTLDSKEVGMEELLHRADELRLETLKAVIEILTPIQAVYFLIAAAELHLRLHDWGKKRETKAVAAAGTETHSHSTGCMT